MVPSNPLFITILVDTYKTFCDAWNDRRSWWFTASSRSRARFARTLLGSFWLGLSNLFSIIILGLVYKNIFKVNDFDHYIVYLGIGLSLWSYVSSSILSAPSIFTNNQRNLLNTNTNPIYYILEEWSFQIQTFAQSFLVVILVLSAFQHNIIFHLFAYSILPFINLFLFMFWLPVLICMFGIRFQDLYQLLPIIMQLLFLLSPILYFEKSLGPYQALAKYNIIYQSLGCVRDSILHGPQNIFLGLILFFVNIILVMTSVTIVSKMRYKLPFYCS